MTRGGVDVSVLSFCKIERVTEGAALAIMDTYPTLQHLYDAYDLLVRSGAMGGGVM